MRDREKSYNDKSILQISKHNAELMELERVWKEKLELQQQVSAQAIEALNYKHHIDTNTKVITNEAQIQSKEEKIKAEYMKKIKKFEKQVTEAARAYALRLQYTEGVLSETRNEAERTHIHNQAQLQVLRDELEMKDRRLLRMQLSVDSVHDVIAACDKWRHEASSLASMVITACGSIHELPELANQKDLVSGLLRGFSNVEKSNESENIRQYEMKKDNVMINRKQMTKLYQLCKKLVDKAADFRVPSVV